MRDEKEDVFFIPHPSSLILHPFDKVPSFPPVSYFRGTGPPCLACATHVSWQNGRSR
jgi:hypothetical protein